jgi:hypothetical protein
MSLEHPTRGGPGELVEAGDLGFLGVQPAPDPATLPPSILADARNNRILYGAASTRRGVAKVSWLQRFDGTTTIRPWGTIHGVGRFQDPNSVDWVIVCADAVAWGCAPGALPYPMPMPAKYRLSGRVDVVQAFDTVYVFRGIGRLPLRSTDIQAGLADCWPMWDAGTAYASGDEVHYGPFVSLSALTSVDNVATAVTTAAHGYVDGQEVTVSGCTPSGYNTRATITVVDDVTFTYPLDAAAGTVTVLGTCSGMEQVWRANATTAAGESPDTTAAKWDRQYTILPSASRAVFAQNRLWVVTSYNPATGTYATKEDFLITTDYQDELHYDLADVGRVNAGDADTIRAPLALPNNQIAVGKQGRVAVIYGAQQDLAEMTVDTDACHFGPVGPWAGCAVANEVYFLANQHGITGLRANALNELQGMSVPLSDAIQPWIRRINWTHAGKASLAWWDSKLYAAVPLDGAEAEGPQCLAAAAVYGSGEYVVTTLRVGQLYRFTAGANEEDLVNGGEVVADGEVFTAAEDVVIRQATGAGAAVTASLVPIYRGVNNAILVYDFALKQWVSLDEGPAIVPRRLLIVGDGARERLAMEGEDGYLSLLEEYLEGDQVQDPDAPNGLGMEPIAWSATSRGYAVNTVAWKRSVEGKVAVATWGATWSLSQVFDGVREERAVLVGRTPSATRYYRPFDAPAWDPTNVNDDFWTPYREDYGVALVTDGVTLGANGVATSLFQEIEQKLGLRTAAGRAPQVQLSTAAGAILWRGVELVQAPEPRRGQTKG